MCIQYNALNTENIMIRFFFALIVFSLTANLCYSHTNSNQPYNETSCSSESLNKKIALLEFTHIELVSYSETLNYSQKGGLEIASPFKSGLNSLEYFKPYSDKVTLDLLLEIREQLYTYQSTLLEIFRKFPDHISYGLISSTAFINESISIFTGNNSLETLKPKLDELTNSALAKDLHNLIPHLLRYNPCKNNFKVYLNSSLFLHDLEKLSETIGPYYELLSHFHILLSPFLLPNNTNH